MDWKPRRLRAAQVRVLPPAEHAAGRAPGLHPRRGVRSAELHPHLVGRRCLQSSAAPGFSITISTLSGNKGNKRLNRQRIVLTNYFSGTILEQKQQKQRDDFLHGTSATLRKHAVVIFKVSITCSLTLSCLFFHFFFIGAIMTQLCRCRISHQPGVSRSNANLSPKTPFMNTS